MVPIEKDSGIVHIILYIVSVSICFGVRVRVYFMDGGIIKVCGGGWGPRLSFFIFKIYDP